MADLIDIHDPRIERDIGDRHGRTPRFVVDRAEWEAGDKSGVLYWPDTKLPPPTPHVSRLEWLARAFRSIDDAAAFVAEMVRCPGSGRTWGSGTGAPICRGCRRGPSVLNAERPRKRGGRWTGRVPEHAATSDAAQRKGAGVK